MMIMDRDGSIRRNGRGSLTARRMKGTVYIPEDLVLHNRDVLAHMLEVLLVQWGLNTVELRLGIDEPGTVAVPVGHTRSSITVAGRSFPVDLEYT